MNFIHFSKLKVFFISVIGVLMFVLIYSTFANKQAYYGHSPMTDIFAWMTSNTYYSTIYKVRAYIGTNEAAALEVFRSNNLSGSNDHTGNAIALPVLVYHTVENGSETLNLERGAFEDQLFALKEAGWETITLKEFQAFMRGTITLPERSFLLTFDDGTKNSYHPVNPLLKVLGYTGVSFILPLHSIGTESHYYLSDYEIDTMLESGLWEIGSHGMDVHEYKPTDSIDTYEAPLVNYLWLEDKGRVETREEYLARIDADLRDSRDALEKRFDVIVSAFAYPFGEYGRPTDSNQNAVPGAVTVAERIYETSFYQWRRGGEFSFNNLAHIYTNELSRILFGQGKISCKDWKVVYLKHFPITARLEMMKGGYVTGERFPLLIPLLHSKRRTTAQGEQYSLTGAVIGTITRLRRDFTCQQVQASRYLCVSKMIPM